MKIVALGGSGGMGQYAVRTILGQDRIDEIVIADLDGAAAVRFAEQCGPKATGAAVDVTDEEGLDRLLSGADAIVNTVGPFFRFGPPVLRAAIRAGCDYIDINDDWESTVAMLEMHEQARRAGITAVIGMGASPGITNLLAVKAIGALDTVDEVFTGWDLGAAIPEEVSDEPSAAMIHGMHQLTGRIRNFDGGRFVDGKPMRTHELDYPGIGRCKTWSIGHPESITFPRYYPDLRKSVNVFVTTPSNLWGMRAIALLVDSHIISLERAAGWAERWEGAGDEVKTTEQYIEEFARFDEDAGRRLPPLFALARGKRDGRAATAAAAVLSAPARGMGGATGVPLGVGLGMLGQLDGDRHGVFAPEAVIDPDAFFDRLAPLCSPERLDSADLLLETRSWESTDLGELLRSRLNPASRASAA